MVGLSWVIVAKQAQACGFTGTGCIIRVKHGNVAKQALIDPGSVCQNRHRLSWVCWYRADNQGEALPNRHLLIRVVVTKQAQVCGFTGMGQVIAVNCDNVAKQAPGVRIWKGFNLHKMLVGGWTRVIMVMLPNRH